MHIGWTAVGQQPEFQLLIMMWNKVFFSHLLRWKKFYLEPQDVKWTKWLKVLHFGSEGHEKKMYTKAHNEISVSAPYVFCCSANTARTTAGRGRGALVLYSKIIMEKLALNLELRSNKTAQCKFSIYSELLAAQLHAVLLINFSKWTGIQFTNYTTILYYSSLQSPVNEIVITIN